MKIQTANQVSGRAVGAMFFTGFGALWLLLSFYARQTLDAGRIIGLAFCTVALLGAAVYLKQQAWRWPRMPDNKRMGRIFGWINAAQWAVVFVVAFIFARLHLDAYIPSAITAIVGLHMFPLAQLFRYPLHHVTGALLVAWAAVSIFVAPVDTLQGMTAMGTGEILWLSAAVTLTLALVATRETGAAVAC
jgi:hypothetical protein